jgi:hypothetical protein
MHGGFVWEGRKRHAIRVVKWFRVDCALLAIPANVVKSTLKFGGNIPLMLNDEYVKQFSISMVEYASDVDSRTNVLYK